MTIYTKEELLQFNEFMLGRGVPVQQDGIGYNKADFGACSGYYYGLSDGQLAGLAKRLIKYTKTQLKIEKQDMKDTYEYLAKIADGEKRDNGVSVDVREDGTLISFKYNEEYIEKLKEIVHEYPERKYDKESKKWIVAHNRTVEVLLGLKNIGAEVNNSLQYVKNHDLIKKAIKPIAEEKVEDRKHKINCVRADSSYRVTFRYNPAIISAIKTIHPSQRSYDPANKSWEIKSDDFYQLREKLQDAYEFNTI